MELDPCEFPAALPEGDEVKGGALAWTSVTMAIATVLLAFFNAATLDIWATELPPGDSVAKIVSATGQWRATMEAAGLDLPRATLHGTWKEMEAARFQRRAAEKSAP